MTGTVSSLSPSYFMDSLSDGARTEWLAGDYSSIAARRNTIAAKPALVRFVEQTGVRAPKGSRRLWPESADDNVERTGFQSWARSHPRGGFPLLFTSSTLILLKRKKQNDAIFKREDAELEGTL